MTYPEAQKVIEENSEALDKYVLHTEPNEIHMVKGTFISPFDISDNTKQFIYEECNEKHKNNADVLMELNLFSKELYPFVVIQYKGNYLIMKVGDYLHSKLVSDNEP